MTKSFRWVTLAGMGDRKNPLGATGRTVAANVAAIRRAANIGYTELARRLDAVGREIPVLGLTRIEKGERRIDADDLVALAAALEVSPATLLMPRTEAQTWNDAVDATGHPDGVTGEQLWAWLTAHRPTSLPAGDLHGQDATELLAWWFTAKPPGALKTAARAPTIHVAPDGA